MKTTAKLQDSQEEASERRETWTEKCDKDAVDVVHSSKPNAVGL